MVRADFATYPALQPTLLLLPNERVLWQSCPSTDALAASYCPSPPLRAAPAAGKTGRTTHQSQRPLGDVALDDGLVRFRTALDEHGAVRRFVPPPADASRLPPHSAADARAAESFTWWALTAHKNKKSSRLRRPQSTEAHHQEARSQRDHQCPDAALALRGAPREVQVETRGAALGPAAHAQGPS